MENPQEPWKHYYEAFAARVARVPGDAFDRGALLFEAAHDVYQTTTNELTSAGWDEERALMVGHMFGAVVKQWVERGSDNMRELEGELRAHYQQWSA